MIYAENTEAMIYAERNDAKIYSGENQIYPNKPKIPDDITSNVEAIGNSTQSPNWFYQWYDTPVDLTNVKTIIFDCTFYYEDGVWFYDDGWNKNTYYYNNYQAMIRISEDKDINQKTYYYVYRQNGSPDIIPKYDGEPVTEILNYTIEIDVSELSGNYYIGLGVRGYNSNGGASKVVSPGRGELRYWGRINRVTFS